MNPYELALAVQDGLRARGWPLAVTFGPERTEREQVYDSVVLMRDRQAGETWQHPSGAHRNPDKVADRMIGLVARVYGRSTDPGAAPHDHEAYCDRLVDATATALRDAMVSLRAGRLDITSGRFLDASEWSDTEAWAGVIYELKFRVPRGVYALRYEGGDKPTAQASGVSNTTEVRRAHSDDPPVTGCGA